MWNDVKKLSSENPNVWKYVFTKEDAVAESVLYKYPTFEERTVICCSTQSGCPVGCRFCGAGDSFVRSLTTEEIVYQPRYLMNDAWITPNEVKRMQIMFMSMGEPMLNTKALFPALLTLYTDYPKAALLISTIGPSLRHGEWDALEQLSVEVPTIGLQFSIHESADDRRDKLIPFRSKMSLREISDVGDEWYSATGRRPFFNYCAHADNTSQSDVDRLSNLFDSGNWNCTVSVICERQESIAAANARQRELAADFMTKMIEAGYDTRMFDPAGQDDIGGGCGQLWYVQKWMRDNPKLAHPSVGRKLPVIHAPSMV